MPEQRMIEVFHFQELEEEAKERARQWLYEVFHDTDRDVLKDEIEILIDQIKKETEVFLEVLDFSYSIGDRGDYLGVRREALETGLSREEVDVSIVPQKVGVWYQDFPFEGLRETECDALRFNWDEDVPDEEREKIEEEICRDFSRIVSLIREAYVHMRDIVTCYPSDEELEELAEANDWLFLKGGSLAPV